MKKRIVFLLMIFTLFLTGFNTQNDYLVAQTDYNCIPASIEMVYRIYGENNTSQNSIRDELDAKHGIVPVYEMDIYLYRNFEYETKKICCEDSFVNSFKGYPILVVYDNKIVDNHSTYQGHCVVAIEIVENEFATYVKVLDPDGGRERLINMDKFIKAIQEWNDEIYIIKDIKRD